MRDPTAAYTRPFSTIGEPEGRALIRSAQRQAIGAGPSKSAKAVPANVNASIASRNRCIKAIVKIFIATRSVQPDSQEYIEGMARLSMRPVIRTLPRREWSRRATNKPEHSLSGLRLEGLPADSDRTDNSGRILPLAGP